MTELQTIGLFLMGWAIGIVFGISIGMPYKRREEPPAIIDLGEFTHGHKWVNTEERT